MGFCCKDLLNLKYFFKSKLLAGESGLNREISWPYVKSTESILQWLYGGELLFVIYRDEKKECENIPLLLNECIEKKVSGIVILMEDKDIDNITEDIISKANEENIPLFILPWDIKLIDIIQEILFKMGQEKEQSKNAKQFFETILFSKEGMYGNIESLSEFYNIKLRPYHYMCIFKIEKIHNATPVKFELINNQIINSLEEVLEQNKYTLIHMEYAGYLMALVFANNYEEGKKSSSMVEDVFNFINSKYENAKLSLSFSRIRETNSNIKTSYEEALKASSMIGIYNEVSNVVRYNDLGIVKLFVELANTNGIYEYCNENLAPIIEYDKTHGVDLIETLKCYFENNRHLVKTSQALFIHRNTLLYRLATIKSLLNTDLNNAITNLELFNSILIYKFLALGGKK